MCLWSYIWLLYDVQLTFLLDKRCLWNDLQKRTICFSYYFEMLHKLHHGSEIHVFLPLT